MKRSIFMFFVLMFSIESILAQVLPDANVKTDAIIRFVDSSALESVFPAARFNIVGVYENTSTNGHSGLIEVNLPESANADTLVNAIAFWSDRSDKVNVHVNFSNQGPLSLFQSTGELFGVILSEGVDDAGGTFVQETTLRTVTQDGFLAASRSNVITAASCANGKIAEVYFTTYTVNVESITGIVSDTAKIVVEPRIRVRDEVSGTVEHDTTLVGIIDISAIPSGFYLQGENHDFDSAEEAPMTLTGTINCNCNGSEVALTLYNRRAVVIWDYLAETMKAVHLDETYSIMSREDWTWSTALNADSTHWSRPYSAVYLDDVLYVLATEDTFGTRLNIQMYDLSGSEIVEYGSHRLRVSPTATALFSGASLRYIESSATIGTEKYFSVAYGNTGQDLLGEILILDPEGPTIGLHGKKLMQIRRNPGVNDFYLRDMMLVAKQLSLPVPAITTDCVVTRESGNQGGGQGSVTFDTTKVLTIPQGVIGLICDDTIVGGQTITDTLFGSCEKFVALDTSTGTVFSIFSEPLVVDFDDFSDCQDFIPVSDASRSTETGLSQVVARSAGGLYDDLDRKDLFGSSVAVIGDIDGNGTTDIIVGAPRLDDATFGRKPKDNGAVFTILLSSDGSTIGYEMLASSTVIGLNLDKKDWFGSSVASIGDLDGNGTDDIFVGASLSDLPNKDAGALYRILIESDGSVTGAAKVSIPGLISEKKEYLGSSLASLPDIDGNGYADLAVGAPGSPDNLGKRGRANGAVYILSMESGGSVSGYQKISETTGGFSLGLDKKDAFGSAVACTDIDGDGIQELLVGAPGDDDLCKDCGAVYVLSLNTDGTVLTSSKISASTGNIPLGTLEKKDLFGSSLAILPDNDGDGLDDLLIGAPGDDDGCRDCGAIYLTYQAGNAGKFYLRWLEKISAEKGRFHPDPNNPKLQKKDAFGSAIAVLGDIDSDENLDVAVGAPGDDLFGNIKRDAGTVHVIFVEPDTTTQEILAKARLAHVVEVDDREDVFADLGAQHRRITEGGLLVSPNPTSGEVYVEGDFTDLSLYTPEGALVYTAKITQKILLQAPPGLYVVSLRRETGEIVHARVVIE